MSDENFISKEIICVQCNIPLQPGKVSLSYLGNTFPTDMLKCPRCGQVYIPEDLVLGRMLEVELALEDK
jgi:predicted RNA-binding Zn-ribbon protein involved in translation (DUF1610 family)